MIKVYSKPNCMQCNFTKKYLEDKGIEFKEINIMDNPESVEELKLYGFNSMPVVANGSLDDAWSGFRPERLEELPHD